MSGPFGGGFAKFGILTGIALVIGLIVTLNTAFQVDAGEVGVVTHWGAVQDDTLAEGLHFALLFWLPGEDSNLYCGSQSPVSYQLNDPALL